MAARCVAVRRSEVSVRLQTVRLHQRERAEGRRNAANRARHLRQFQYGGGRVKGTLALGIDLIYDTLLVSALDEVLSSYGLIAEAVHHPDDFSSVSYRLRAEAKWHDGTPVTPDDVIFSFNTFKKLSPQSAASYVNVVKAEKTGDREVTFAFKGTGHHRLPELLGQLTILPKAWWEGTDDKKRDIGSTTLEPPLGSGPYAIKEFTPGRSIVYERDEGLLGQRAKCLAIRS